MDPAAPVPTIAPKKNRLLTPLLILILLIILGIGTYFLFFQKSSSTKTTTATTETKTATTSAPVVDDTTLITKALVAKTGIASDKIDVTVTTKVDNFAKGTVSTKGEETGGGYYLAVKDKGNWYIVYDGQATPNCVQVDPFSFPTSMVPECLDSNGNLVTR